MPVLFFVLLMDIVRAPSDRMRALYNGVRNGRGKKGVQ